MKEVKLKEKHKKKKEEKNLLIKHIKGEIHNRKIVFTLYWFLRLSVIFVLIAQFFNRNYENVFLCILTLFLFLVPSFLEKKFRIRFPDTMEIIIFLFIYAAEILGEIHAMYIKIPMWDTMLHTLNGFLVAAIGFSLVDLLNRNERFSLELAPSYLALVAFCFSMTIGIFWEFFEFGMDYFFHMDMQKDTVLTSISSVTLNPQGLNNPIVIDQIKNMSLNGQVLPVAGYLDIGLYDTIEDLFVNFVGAIVFSVIGYFYVKSKGKSKIAEQFIPEVINDEIQNLEKSENL